MRSQRGTLLQTPEGGEGGPGAGAELSCAQEEGLRGTGCGERALAELRKELEDKGCDGRESPTSNGRQREEQVPRTAACRGHAVQHREEQTEDSWKMVREAPGSRASREGTRPPGVEGVALRLESHVWEELGRAAQDLVPKRNPL